MCMPLCVCVCVVCVCECGVCVCVQYVYPGLQERFYELSKKNMAVLKSKPWRSLVSFMIKKTTADSVYIITEEHWIHQRLTWSIAVREWLLELFCEQTCLLLLWHWM